MVSSFNEQDGEQVVSFGVEDGGRGGPVVGGELAAGTVFSWVIVGLSFHRADMVFVVATFRVDSHFGIP